MPWHPIPLSYAVAIYPFQPGPSPAELPLQIGDQLYVIEQGGKDDAWCRGYLLAAPSLMSALSSTNRSVSDARVFSGVFPRCCIDIREELGSEVANGDAASEGKSKPPAPVPLLKIGDESESSSSEPLVDEIASCLREWYILHLPEVVLRRDYEVLENMSAITTRLDYARRQLLNDVLTVQERMGVRNDAVWDLVRGNRMLSGEVIVRNPVENGRLLTAEDSIIEMSKLQSVMSVLNASPEDKPDLATMNHCLLEITSVSGSELETGVLNIALYEKLVDGTFVPFSETFSAPAASKMKTLLADLNSRDISSNDHLFLVVKVVALELAKKEQVLAGDRAPSQNGNVRGQKDSGTKKRTSMLFSKRNKDRQSTMNGRTSSAQQDRSLTPSIPEEGDGEKPTQNTGPSLPRTIGVGMIDIAHIMRNNKPEEDLSVTVWAASHRNDDKTTGWNPLIASMLHSPGQSFAICNKISKVQFSFTPYVAPDSETLIRNNPTSLHLVSRTQKMGFSEAPSKSRSDIYLTLSKAVIAAGAQLSHPEVGLTPIRSDTLLNLQLTMEVRDSAGRRVEHCIWPSSNGTGVTAFRTNAAELNSEWDQTVCLKIPTHKVADCHLVLSVADAPEFPFALAWIPLWDKQAFLSDGKHSLILHAYDKSTSSIVRGRGAYLSLPWNSSSFAAADGSKAQVACLEIRTKLCSTEFSQDRLLVSLINWKHQSSLQLLDLLQKLVFVPEIEVVKQLNDVLDALFAVLVHKAGESRFEDLIFNDIVFVLGIVHDRRFNLGPLVEQYAEETFDAPFAASSLVRSFTRLLQSVSDPQSARDMRALFKVGKQFMKLLMASYVKRRSSMNQSLKDKDKKHVNFKEDMQAVLFGLQMMMRSETPALVGSKTLLVQNFHTWLAEMLPAYSKDEIIKIAVDFVDSGDEATGKLALYRLILIYNYIKTDAIWYEPKDRNQLVKHCLRWLAPHFTANNITDEWRDQVRLCCSIVAELTKIGTTHLQEFLPQLINAYCYLVTEPSPRKRTLSPLFGTVYPFTTKPAETTDLFDETLLELAALISTIARTKQSGPPKLQDQDLSTYILAVLTVQRSLLNGDAFPPTWLSLHIHHHSCALGILTYLDSLLQSSFLPAPEEAEHFDMPLWKAYLETLLALVSSPALTLEAFPEQKRRVVWKIAGDVRQAGADLLRRSWESLGWEAEADDQRRYNIKRLGGYQVQYVPALVGPIIELCLSMHEGLRRVAVEILQTMIVSEWALSEDLNVIETEVIGALNTLLRGRSVTANEAISRKSFIGELLALFGTIAEQPDDALWMALQDLVSTVEELIDLLTNTEPEEDEEDEAEHPPAAAAAATTASESTPTAEEPVQAPSISSSAAAAATAAPPRTSSIRTGRTSSMAGTATTPKDRRESFNDMERARRSIDRNSTSGGTREYGVNALECYKQLAEEYEKTGDYKRLAKTYRAIARIHEARAKNKVGSESGRMSRVSASASARYSRHDEEDEDDDE